MQVLWRRIDEEARWKGPSNIYIDMLPMPIYIYLYAYIYIYTTTNIETQRRTGCHVHLCLRLLPTSSPTLCLLACHLSEGLERLLLALCIGALATSCEGKEGGSQP